MSKWPKSGNSLSRDEHLQAEELINELQERWMTLLDKGDEHVKRAVEKGYRRPRPENFSPDTYEINFGGDKIVLKKGQSRISATHNGNDVLRLYQGSITLIDNDALARALGRIRQYMILDDLANI